MTAPSRIIQSAQIGSSTLHAEAPIAAVLFGIVLLASGLLGEYERFVGVQILVSALLAVSFRGLFRTGVFSLAGPGFMGLGAYAYSLLQLEAHGSPWLAICLALAACFLVACMLGPIVWRVARIYLALLTLSLVVILTMIYGELRITGGHGGRYGVEIPVSGGVGGWNWFLVCVVSIGLVLTCLAALERAPLGRAWRAIGVDAAYAESVGVPSKAHSYGAFALYSTVAGFAGIIMAGNNGYIYPDAFGFERVVFMLLSVFVGGVSMFIGPIIGALFVGVLMEFLSSYQQYTMVILGSTLVIVMMVFPNGLISIPAALWALVPPARRRALRAPLPDSRSHSSQKKLTPARSKRGDRR
ncbi:branched-chain amino acid transport system permease protein [Rhizobiales bacterium GAS113]|nr:branched-chain amino acid transport system permease protein [Rhizobiales bacterium GAS113]